MIFSDALRWQGCRGYAIWVALRAAHRNVPLLWWFSRAIDSAIVTPWTVLWQCHQNCFETSFHLPSTELVPQPASLPTHSHCPWGTLEPGKAGEPFPLLWLNRALEDAHKSCLSPGASGKRCPTVPRCFPWYVGVLLMVSVCLGLHPWPYRVSMRVCSQMLYGTDPFTCLKGSPSSREAGELCGMDAAAWPQRQPLVAACRAACQRRARWEEIAWQTPFFLSHYCI